MKQDQSNLTIVANSQVDEDLTIDEVITRNRTPIAICIHPDDDGSPKLNGVIDLRGEFTLERFDAALAAAPDHVRSNALRMLDKFKDNPKTLRGCLVMVTNLLEEINTAAALAG